MDPERRTLLSVKLEDIASAKRWTFCELLRLHPL